MTDGERSESRRGGLPPRIGSSGGEKRLQVRATRQALPVAAGETNHGGERVGALQGGRRVEAFQVRREKAGCEGVAGADGVCDAWQRERRSEESVGVLVVEAVRPDRAIPHDYAADAAAA